MNRDKIYSKRAQEWVDAAKHQLSSNTRNEYLQDSSEGQDLGHIFRMRPELASFQLEFWGKIIESTDHSPILQSLHYSGDLGLAPRAYLEAFCQLSLNKTRLKLVKITSREVEHFLRDQNHLPALYEQNDNRPPAWFEEMQKIIPSLIEQMLLFEGREESADILPFNDFGESATLPEKLRILESFFELHIRKALIQDGGNVVIKALNTEGDSTQVYLDFSGECQSCPSSKKGTWQFIQTQLQKYFKGKVEARAY